MESGSLPPGRAAGLTPVTVISDADDPRVAAYREIRERDLVGRQGRFVAEGEVVLRVLLRQGRYPVESILVADGRVAGLTPLLAEAPPDVPVFAAPQAVMDRIAGFSMHRGILAIGARGTLPAAGSLLATARPAGIALVLVGIANHDNMGGIFRNAAAFGVDAVLIDATSCDPLYRKAIRVSVGGALTVPFARLAPDADPVAVVADAGYAPIGLSPAGTEELERLSIAGRTALFLGAEGPGLPAAILERLSSVRIAMAGGFDSLNVATASGIALYHLTRGSRAP